MRHESANEGRGNFGIINTMNPYLGRASATPLHNFGLSVFGHSVSDLESVKRKLNLVFLHSTMVLILDGNTKIGAR